MAAVQFDQYVHWLSAVCPCVGGLLRDEPTPAKRRQTLCHGLRDGVLACGVAGSLAGKRVDFLKTQAGTTLAVCMHNYSLAYSVMVDMLGADPNVLPHPATLFAAKFDAVALLLHQLFHSTVLRERVALHSSMMAWYRDVAYHYKLPFASKVLDLQSMADGVLWACVFHNLSLHNSSDGNDDNSFQLISDELANTASALRPLDLSTVYLRPQSMEQIVANISFVYCLFDLQHIDPFFPTVGDFVYAANGTFLFMQAFTIFQMFASIKLKAVNHRSIVFADGPLEAVSSAVSARAAQETTPPPSLRRRTSAPAKTSSACSPSYSSRHAKINLKKKTSVAHSSATVERAPTLYEALLTKASVCTKAPCAAVRASTVAQTYAEKQVLRAPLASTEGPQLNCRSSLTPNAARCKRSREQTNRDCAVVEENAEVICECTTRIPAVMNVGERVKLHSFRATYDGSSMRLSPLGGRSSPYHLPTSSIVDVRVTPVVSGSSTLVVDYNIENCVANEALPVPYNSIPKGSLTMFFEHAQDATRLHGALSCRPL